MKRLSYLLPVLVFLASACGGGAPEPISGGDGIAALEDGEDAGEGGKTSVGGGTKADKKKAKGGSEKQGTKNGKSGKSSASGGGTTSSTDANDGGGSTGGGGATSGGGGANAGGGSRGGVRSAAPVPRGTHSYDTDGHVIVSGNRRDMPETTTLTAHAPRGAEQTQVRDLRDGNGNGTVVETRLLYRKEGVYLTYVKITATFPGGFTDVRELRPRRPELVAPTGARPGSSASFVMTGSGTKAAVNSRAVRVDRVTIGGSSVSALVVDTNIKFSGALEGRQNSTIWFWGKHVLALREQVSTDVRNGPIRFQSDYEALLKRLP